MIQKLHGVPANVEKDANGLIIALVEIAEAHFELSSPENAVSYFGVLRYPHNHTQTLCKCSPIDEITP